MIGSTRKLVAVVVEADRAILTAIDRRYDWHRPAVSVSEFMDHYVSSDGDKYSEPNHKDPGAWSSLAKLSDAVYCGRVRSEELKGHLDMLLMAVLCDRPAHGYLIVERLGEASGGEFDLPEGTVYLALHRLERGGFLRSGWMVVGGRRRRVYELTGQGKAELAGRREAWERFSAGVRRTLEAT